MAAQAQTPAVRPVDSLEVRWMVAGQLGTAMREWFTRFPTGTEDREDAYLLQPCLPGLSVKLRNGSALEVKSYLGSPGILDLPRRSRGRLELWRKWSFPCRQSEVASEPPVGWGPVRKTRCRTWIPLVAGQDPVPDVPTDAQVGCLVELTQAYVRAESWWSVGFEATGSAGMLRAALGHAADLVFAQALPPGAELGLENSQSYARWLSRRHGPGHRDTAVADRGSHRYQGAIS